MSQNTEILQIEMLCKNFGGLRAVKDFEMTVPVGGLYGLIGPNGAGKTTVFNLITGLYAITSGTIHFDGQSIIGLQPHEITRLGIARTFQNIRLFPNLTVLDNVRIAYHGHAGYSMIDSLLRTPRYDEKEAELTERAQEFLEVFNLHDRQGEIAKNLPYGEQRRLEIARALAADPKLLLLDEPSLGLAPLLVKDIFQIIRRINQEQGTTLMVVEQNANMALQIAHYGYVMENGKIVLESSAEDLQENPDVKEFYLGTAASGALKSYKDVKAYKRRKRWL